MSTDRNYWATYRDSIAFWEGNLPPPAKLGMERVFEFARHILDTAEREQVMRVLGVPAPPSAKNCDELSWFEFFRARFEREGRLNLFPGYPSIPERFGGGRLRLPARLAYYQGDRIIEEEVEDVGDLEKAVVMARETTLMESGLRCPSCWAAMRARRRRKHLAGLPPEPSPSTSPSTPTSGSRASKGSAWVTCQAVRTSCIPLAAETD